MIFEFNTDTIYYTVGNLIQASKQCRKSIHPKGIKHRIFFKLYDYKENLIDDYSGSNRGWAKLIKKDMHRIQRGTIESFCSPHPII
jgi:hypothetical protein